MSSRVAVVNAVALAVLSPSLLGACRFTLHDGVTVDGVRLTERHEETLTLERWPEGGLTLVVNQGDVTLERAEGPITLVVEVLERAPGEARAHFEGGVLAVRGMGDAPCALGSVRLRAPSAPGDLHIETGLGDVRLVGLEVAGALEISSGLGDLDLRAAGAPARVHLASGKGDIRASDLRCARFAAETGLGDVRVDGLEASETAEVSSGLGDLEVVRSKGARLAASTGLGDVEVVESSFAVRALDSGLGRVREH
jgi:hypothetical protein